MKEISAWNSLERGFQAKFEGHHLWWLGGPEKTSNRNTLMPESVWHLVDEKFRKNPRPFIVQSALASLIVFLTLWILEFMSPVIIAAIGSTVFIVFAMPKAASARPRAIFGGHVLCMLIGLACSGIFFYVMPDKWGEILAGSLAVGIAIFVMVIFDFEHPPAAGTALGFALGGFNPFAITFIVVASMVLSTVHVGLRQWMENLV